jgi:hypothetical protein
MVGGMRADQGGQDRAGRTMSALCYDMCISMTP